MPKPIEDLFEEKARAGDGNFAIAFALLKLAEEQAYIGKKLGNLGFDGPGGDKGALEYIGNRLGGIQEALSCLIVNASISGSLDIDNG